MEYWYVNGAPCPTPIQFSVNPAPTGSISASPNPCSIPSGESLCTSALSWSSQGSSAIEVVVSQNNGSPALYAITGGGGPFTGNAPWIQASNTYVFTLYDYSSGSQGPFLGNVEVIGVPANISCGSTTVTGDPASPGNNITLSVSAPGATSLYFAITGATTNPYTGRANATLTGGSTWTATVGTGSLLGEYKVLPMASNNSGTTTCGNATEVFGVSTNSPALPGRVQCASMTGIWSDVASGQPTFTWNLSQTSGTGYQTITGTGTSTTDCGQHITWNVTGSYFDGGTYNVYGTGGSPATFSCNGNYTTLNQYINGALNGGGSCGIGGGVYEASVPTTGTLENRGNNTVTAMERIPTEESTNFSSWGDAYGAPTTAVFNMVLTGPPGMNFGGRSVTETIPQGTSGSDKCYWAQAPWPAPFTELATQDTWYVQTNTGFGYYGPDYVGLGGDITAYIQLFSPAVQNSGSCTIQYPQLMVINKETGAGTEAYGGQQSGNNQIVFTIATSQISVARGNASQTRLFHF